MKDARAYLLAKMRLGVLADLGPLKHFEEAERLRLLDLTSKFESQPSAARRRIYTKFSWDDKKAVFKDLPDAPR